MSKSWLRNIGPGTLVAAAFIGPGTVTVCTLAGAQFGFALLWAMTLSIIATVILQEMAARLGVISQKGLAEVVRSEIANPVAKRVVMLLILAAIFIGNAAYEAGNISGGALGLATVLGTTNWNILGVSVNYISLLLGSLAFILLYIGNYKILEKVLISLVLVMSISFVLTAIMTRPSITAIFKNALVPNFPKDSILTIIGLIGTTVVPYNLFLHASLVKEKWRSDELSKAKKDTFVSIVLGGVVSMAIIIASSAMQDVEIHGATDLAEGLVPLYGASAKYFLSAGLFAAGITSAVTAPLAAAYVVKGCLGWAGGLKSSRFRAVWMVVLVLGTLFSSTGLKPIEIIKFAQIANGLLLPVIAIVLLWIMNRKAVLGKFTNSSVQNILALIIVLVTLLLGLKSILKVFEIL